LCFQRFGIPHRTISELHLIDLRWWECRKTWPEKVLDGDLIGCAINLKGKI
jgi:hypothetical protein